MTRTARLAALAALVVATSGCQLYGWGFNEGFGSVGDGTTEDRNEPVSLGPGSWRTVSAGAYHSCAIRWNDTTWCWGRNDDFQVGDGTDDPRLSPTQIADANAGYTAVSAGVTHTCALKQDTTIWCWGSDFQGQFGDGLLRSPTNSSAPIQTQGDGWVDVDAGGDHTCGIRADGTAWCWGWNFFGQMGNGTFTSRARPFEVAGGSDDWATISAGGGHTCATRTDGTGWCWGANFDGALGVGDDVGLGGAATSPMQVPGEWASIETGGRHTCGTQTDGSLWCWGGNDDGELGLGEGAPVNVTSPLQLDGLDWAEVAPGFGHTCALRTDDTAWCWGDNFRGAVGDGTNDDRSVPTAVAGDHRWTAISSGYGHVVAILAPEPPPSLSRPS